MHWLANPDVQGLIFTLIGYAWLTHMQAVLPPSIEARIPAPLLAALKALAGNYGAAKNTQAPLGPTSPLAAAALTALCLGAALLPALASKPAPAVQVPAPQGLALPLPEAATAVVVAADATATD